MLCGILSNTALPRMKSEHIPTEMIFPLERSAIIIHLKTHFLLCLSFLESWLLPSATSLYVRTRYDYCVKKFKVAFFLATTLSVRARSYERI